MKSFAVVCALFGSALCAPAADPYVNGAVAGPLTAAFGDLVSTNRGLRPLSLEGFFDPIAQAVAPVVHAAPLVHAAVHAAPVVAAAAPVANHAAPVVHAAPVATVHNAVYHTVHHVPQVHVAKQTYTHTTHHVITHAPVVGSYLSGLPV